jgi:hypothetical protein
MGGANQGMACERRIGSAVRAGPRAGRFDPPVLDDSALQSSEAAILDTGAEVADGSTELSQAEWVNLSADSMAWSRTARLENVCLRGHDRPGSGRRKGHRRCTSCLGWALMWREKLVASVA